MHKDSPWYLFHPTSPGWIKRKLKAHEYVSAEDIARVLEHHPHCASDSLIVAHTVSHLRGDVLQMPGRKQQSLGRKIRIWFAGQQAREQMAQWRHGIGDDCPKKGRGEPGLSEAAYAKFAPPLGMSGRGLANAISALKSDWLFGE